MSAALIVQLITTLAQAVGEIAPLVAQGQAVLSQSDAAAVHAALVKAEAATASLRPQVDAALSAAAAR
jgi:O-succinylbenzoate synthase